MWPAMDLHEGSARLCEEALSGGHDQRLITPTWDPTVLLNLHPQLAPILPTLPKRENPH